MTNWYAIFYWLTVADNAKVFFITFICIFTAIAVAATLTFICARSPEDLSAKVGGVGERAKKWMWWSYPFMILFWGLFIFTPSKLDVLFILAGGSATTFLTSDSSAKKIPADITNFVHRKLQSYTTSLDADTKAELGIPKTPREQLVDKIKKLTKDQSVIDLITNDTTALK